jgi:hypothetical protein
MAERVDSSLLTSTRNKHDYPWDDWLDGSTWKVVKGVDFTVPVSSMRSECYIQAAKRKGKALTHATKTGDGLIFRFEPFMVDEHHSTNGNGNGHNA